MASFPAMSTQVSTMCLRTTRTTQINDTTLDNTDIRHTRGTTQMSPDEVYQPITVSVPWKLTYTRGWSSTAPPYTPRAMAEHARLTDGPH